MPSPPVYSFGLFVDDWVFFVPPTTNWTAVQDYYLGDEFWIVPSTHDRWSDPNSRSEKSLNYTRVAELNPNTGVLNIFFSIHGHYTNSTSGYDLAIHWDYLIHYHATEKYLLGYHEFLTMEGAGSSSGYRNNSLELIFIEREYTGFPLPETTTVVDNNDFLEIPGLEIGVDLSGLITYCLTRKRLKVT